jgi:Sap, sulfolipid-1-addressing protein
LACTVWSVQHVGVSLDALVLALASVIRLTSVASVYAMLSTARPTRLLTAYIVSGFVFSAAIGIVLVTVLGVSTAPHARDEVRAVIAITLGAISLSYAAGLLSGLVSGPVHDRADAYPGPDSKSWLGRQLADLSIPRAAIVGVLTHLPGLFYLAALSAIINSTPSSTSRILQVVLYNAIWFAMPLTALVLASRRSEELQQFLRWITVWIWRHQREIMITVFGIIGVYLIVRGVVDLQP